MENQENIAGLGKNHDREAHDHDISKKQSEAQPAAENLETEPYSVNKDGNKGFGGSSENEAQKSTEVHDQANDYAKQEHEKAENWENTNEEGPDSPQF
jgi:cellulase/cellobiase CelA1